MLSLVISVGLMSGCGKSAAEKENNTSKKKSVVCTIFPEYDWTKEIIGNLSDEYELTLLLDNGVDLHSYQPTAADIAKIANCDAFIYVGGESDGWVEDALAEDIARHGEQQDHVEGRGQDLEAAVAEGALVVGRGAGRS